MFYRFYVFFKLEILFFLEILTRFWDYKIESEILFLDIKGRFLPFFGLFWGGDSKLKSKIRL